MTLNQLKKVVDKLIAEGHGRKHIAFHWGGILYEGLAKIDGFTYDEENKCFTAIQGKDIQYYG